MINHPANLHSLRSATPLEQEEEQEELTLLLDAGRNICGFCWGGWDALLAKTGFMGSFCRNGGTRHSRSPVLAGVLQVSFTSTSTDHTSS